MTSRERTSCSISRSSGTSLARCATTTKTQPENLDQHLQIKNERQHRRSKLKSISHTNTAHQSQGDRFNCESQGKISRRDLGEINDRQQLQHELSWLVSLQADNNNNNDKAKPNSEYIKSEQQQQQQGALIKTRMPHSLELVSDKNIAHQQSITSLRRRRRRREAELISEDDDNLSEARVLGSRERVTKTRKLIGRRMMLRPSRRQVILLSVAMFGLFALLVSCAMQEQSGDGSKKQLLQQKSHKASSAWTAIVDKNPLKPKQQSFKHNNCSIFNNDDCQTSTTKTTTTTSTTSTTIKPHHSKSATTESGMSTLAVASLEAPSQTTMPVNTLIDEIAEALHVTEPPVQDGNNKSDPNEHQKQHQQKEFSQLLSISGHQNQKQQQQQDALTSSRDHDNGNRQREKSTTASGMIIGRDAANSNIVSNNDNSHYSPVIASKRNESASNNVERQAASEFAASNGTLDPLVQSAASKSAGFFLAKSSLQQQQQSQLNLIDQRPAKKLDDFYGLSKSASLPPLEQNDQDESNNDDSDADLIWHANQNNNNNNNDNDNNNNADNNNKANYHELHHRRHHEPTAGQLKFQQRLVAQQQHQQMLINASGQKPTNAKIAQQPQLQATNIYQATHLGGSKLNNTSLGNKRNVSIIPALIRNFKQPQKLLQLRAEARNEPQTLVGPATSNPQQLNAMWQNVLVDAINQIISLSSHQRNNENNPQQNQRLALSSTPLESSFNPFDANQFNWLNTNNNQLQRHQHQLADSNSAPSVSLPPLSHLLIPRNPFKLFASVNSNGQMSMNSAASNLAQRIKPAFLLQTAASNNNNHNKFHHNRPQSSQHQNQFTQPQLVLIGNHNQNNQDQDNSGGFSESFALPSEVISGGLNSESSTRPIVYAHSSSVEQLEKLIKAAAASSSQIPAILPAIVSAPNGPIAAFYIPAIDSGPGLAPPTGNDQNHNQPETNFGPSMSAAASTNHNNKQEQYQHEHVQQSNRHVLVSNNNNNNHNNNNHNKMFMELNVPSASQVNQLASSLAISKIPGTDYILHPEEVRAMINIGELAWQKQLGNNQDNTNSNGNQQHSSSSTNQVNRFAPISNVQKQMPLSTERFQDQQNRELNLMQENHAENARDFAYMEPIEFDRRPINNNNNHMQQGQQHMASSSDQITTLQHSHRAQSPSPASTQPVSLIRLNRHHFMPWSHQMTPAASQQQSQSRPTQQFSPAISHALKPAFHFANPMSGKLTSAQPASELHGQRLLELAAFSPQIRAQLQSISHQHRHQINENINKNNNRGHLGAADTNNLEQSSSQNNLLKSNGQSNNHNHVAAPTGVTDNSVRVATQLTPQEISLVEDSILEALMIAQHSMSGPQRHTPNMAGLRTEASSSNFLGHFPSRHNGHFQQSSVHQPMALASRPHLHWSSPPSSLSQHMEQSMDNHKSKQQTSRKPYSWLESFKLRRRFSPKSSSPMTMSTTTTTSTTQASPAADLGKLLAVAASSSPQTFMRPLLTRAQPPNVMSVVPLINVSSLLTSPSHLVSQGDSHDEFTFDNPAEIADFSGHSTSLSSMNEQASSSMVPIDDLRDRMASKQPMQPVMADQETNKPQVGVAHLGGSQLEFSASEPQTVMLSAAPADFGSRLQASSSNVGQQQQPHLVRKVVKQHLQNPQQKVHFNQNIAPTTVPAITTPTVSHEDKMKVRDELYNVLIGNRSSSKGNGQRINVDWPPMTSDADYFPHANNNNVNSEFNTNQQHHQQQQQQQYEYARNQDNDQRSRVGSMGGKNANESKSIPTTTTTQTTIIGDVLSGQPSSLRSYQNNNNNQIGSSSNFHKLRNKQQEQHAHHAGNFASAAAATSQVPKLQFAPDYQAREGVPIYNNNVRISGSLLNRQKSNAD